MSPPRKLCGRPLKEYALNRLRESSERPACGLPAGHQHNCVSAESLKHSRRVRSENRRRTR